ncbi:sensor domain-containing diguanylate cyclase [Candidatus Aminicenantes bacterium AC-335-A11]|nr:sensor domain-containing diguanylate cyclase [Candidatus Aminicenantes bacterium AC-335-A11]
MASEANSQELKKKIQQMKLLHQIGLKIVSVFDLNELLSSVVNLTREILGYDDCAIFLVQNRKLVLKALAGFPNKVLGKEIPFGKGVVGRCAEKREIINIGDVSKCSFYIPSGLENIKSEIALPIVFSNKLLGVLTIESSKKNAFTKDDEETLDILCSQIGVAIQNINVTQSKIKEMEFLHQIGLKIVSKVELDELLSCVVNLIKDKLGYSFTGIFLPVGKKLVLKAHSMGEEAHLGFEIKFGEGVVGKSAESKEVINVGDISKCDFYIPSELKDAKSALAIPILHENRLFGVLAVESSEKNAFKKDDIKLLKILCSQIGIALRNVEMHEELQKLAITDSLTGLYNYRFFRNRLEQEITRAKRYGRPLSLIFIDIDDFKFINDNFGHLKGDEVLIAIARLILDNIRKVDSVSIMKEVEIDIAVRYGGEEFMVILPETPLQGAISAGERLRKLIKKEVNEKIPLIYNGRRFMITSSVGVASLKEDDTSNDLIKRVDQAMYDAKKKGKDQVCWIE